MSRIWLGVAARVALVAAAGMVVGALFGRPALMAAMALALILARELQQLRRLQRWLRTDRLDEAPDAGGVWSDVVGMVARLHRRKQYHKRRLLRLSDLLLGRRKPVRSQHLFGDTSVDQRLQHE